MTIWRALKHQLGMWYTVGLLSVPVVGLAKHFPLRRARWLIGTTVYLLSSVLFSLLHTTIFYAPARPLTFFRSNDFVIQIVRHYPLHLSIFLCIVLLYHAYQFFRKAHNREVRASQTEALLAQSQLQTLKMQLEPHFLFNTLHSVASTMYEDVDKAHEMITRLGDLLRRSIESSQIQEVTLLDELTFVDDYLEIQQMRFGDRLRYTKHIAVDTEKALVPSLILQPLVENAIRHGIEPFDFPLPLGPKMTILTKDLEMKYG